MIKLRYHLSRPYQGCSEEGKKPKSRSNKEKILGILPEFFNFFSFGHFFSFHFFDFCTFAFVFVSTSGDRFCNFSGAKFKPIRFVNKEPLFRPQLKTRCVCQTVATVTASTPTWRPSPEYSSSGSSVDQEQPSLPTSWTNWRKPSRGPSIQTSTPGRSLLREQSSAKPEYR